MKTIEMPILIAVLVLSAGFSRSTQASDVHPEEITTMKGRIVCYSGQLMIDGKFSPSAICATNESKFFGGGEPKISVGVNNRRLFQVLASQTSDALSTKFGGSVITLKCSQIKSESTGSEVGRICEASSDGVVGYSVKINFAGR